MTPDEIYEVLKAHHSKYGWSWFSKAYDLNLWGLRADSNIPDGWDDVIGIAYLDAHHRPQVERFVATTDPGKAYLTAPMNSGGTLIVEPGYHRGLWAPGVHAGRYAALVQVGPVQFRRDADRDALLDRDGVVQVGTGLGVNLHHGGGSTSVGRFSAGCQVLRFPAALSRVLALVELQRQHGHGDRVSYVLHAVTTAPALRPVLGLGG